MRVGVTAILCVAATLQPVRLGSAAAAAPGSAALPAAAKPAPTVPYRVGYTSSDVPRLAAVDAGSGAPAAPPTGDLRAEEASTRPGAVVFVTHRTGQVDTDLTYQATGTTAPRLLTSDDATDRNPALSPDGRRVAFESDRRGRTAIWVVNVDGSGLRRVTSDTDRDTADRWPTWSPTGDRIAFGSNRDDPRGDIYVVPAAGGPIVRLTEHLAADTEPAWSPMNGTVAFTTTRFQPSGGTGTDIAAVSDGGGAVRRLHPGEQPSWSPDGTRLAYVTRDADPSGDIAARITATGVVRVVAGKPAQAETDPTWQGSLVVYTEVQDSSSGDPGPDTDIWSAAADGQDRRDHTNRPGLQEADPAFSPNGRHLAYTEYDAERRSRIVVADADGRHPRPLTDFSAETADSDPTWSPDGTMIALTREVVREERSTIQMVRTSDGAIVGTVPVPDYLNGNDSEPAWAPDGKHVAFTREATLWPPLDVSPGPVDRRVNPGGSTTVEQVVRTPAIPPTPDIVLLIDTTGSMEPALTDVKTNVKTVVDSVRKERNAAQFAVASYRDVGDRNELFRVRQRLTDQVSLIQNAVDGLNAGGGGDAPEGWINALYRVATDQPPKIHYREGSSRIVVLVGDASSHDPSNGITKQAALDSLRAAGIRVVAVAVGEGKPGQDPNGLDSYGQATDVTEATKGTLVAAPKAANVTAAILKGLQDLDVTVTPTVITCDPGLTVTFDPESITVTGGTYAHVRQTATVASSARPGSVLRCTIEYRLSPNPGGASYRVPLVIRVNDPRLPLVTVDNVTVPATDAHGAVVTYEATAIDANGRRLRPVCRPPSGSVFPVGQTTVTCTATDASGRVGRDTAYINVVSRAGTGPDRIWVATLEFPTSTEMDVVAQVDLSQKVSAPCPAQTDDHAPAWSPDGKELAFTAKGRLCVVDADGAYARTPIEQPPANDAEASDPAWSPDGALIAYGWQERSELSPLNTSIRTVPSAGGPPTVLIDTPGDVSQPTFHRVSPRPPPPPRSSPGLRLSVAAPRPGYVGGTPIEVVFTVRNPNTYPVRQVRLAVDVPAKLFAPAPERTLGSLPGRGTATVTIALPPTGAGTGVLRGQVTGLYAEDRRSNARAQAPVVVRQPVLQVVPAVGPPGFVTLAAGRDFPPRARVTLTWDRGISAPTRARVAADGTFEAQMLVFHHDMLGPRQLVVSGPGFGAVREDFLVVAANLDPRDFVQRR